MYQYMIQAPGLRVEVTMRMSCSVTRGRELVVVDLLLRMQGYLLTRLGEFRMGAC